MEANSTSNSTSATATIFNNSNELINTSIEKNNNIRLKSRILIPVMNNNNDNVNHDQRNSDLTKVTDVNRRSSPRKLKFLSNLKAVIPHRGLSISDIRFHSLVEQLRVLNLCTIIIIGDGNCFLWTISRQLFGTQIHHC
ncbi:unnamed protein product [Rotaria sp. Silwood2]|nr:unnamed protein product [Rotaria sp. Silwood2]CAF3224281.1 unnamed protein product [Rotaria sp. Silwood2]CAF3972072.1 unnamed protein product [Rotaria sp. Silwood2]CAF4590293.1 unnamed protein product [Rotaria sp. Silwood2]CAF4626049.1 unnamed protein product [Rotaria sp. Silwood2]